MWWAGPRPRWSLTELSVVILHVRGLRSAGAGCEWAAATILFALFGLLAVDFSDLQRCTLQLLPRSGPCPGPCAPSSLQQMPPPEAF